MIGRKLNELKDKFTVTFQQSAVKAYCRPECEAVFFRPFRVDESK
jgi:hypothetical protein